MQRWLYFVKYLRLYGWEPIVYTVENGEYPYLDNGLNKHIPEGVTVIRRPILEPYSWYRKITGQKQKVNPTIFAEQQGGSLIKRLSVWIRGNLFIPDPRFLWVRPSVNFLIDYLSKNPVDVIASSGPPHSMHLIARNIKRKIKTPWLADFRDPWTQIYFFNQMHMSSFAKKMHRQLEQSVLNEADCLVTVSNSCKHDFEKIVNRKIHVITNGYEEFDLTQTKKQDHKIRMLYAGVLSLDRNPVLFWKLLNEFIHSRQDLRSKFELWLIGNIDFSIIESIQKTELKEFLHYLPSIPHHELQTHLNEADILLLIGVQNHPGVVTGKFFEYLYLKKPIYSISPSDSDLVDILNETQSGYNADFTDESELKNNINKIFDNTNSFEAVHVEKYSRKNITGKLAKLLDGLIKITN